METSIVTGTKSFVLCCSVTGHAQSSSSIRLPARDEAAPLCRVIRTRCNSASLLGMFVQRKANVYTFFCGLKPAYFHPEGFPSA